MQLKTMSIPVPSHTCASIRGTEQTELDPSQWVDLYSAELFRYALSRLRDTNAAEEVVQETFLSGVRYSDQFAGRGTEQSWLLGILKRKIVDHVRQRSRHATVTTYENEADLTNQLFKKLGNWNSNAIVGRSASTASLDYRDLLSVVEKCLLALPHGQSDVFRLRVFEEMSAEQICDRLDISRANYWVRLHRARLRMAASVSKKQEHS